MSDNPKPAGHKTRNRRFRVSPMGCIGLLVLLVVIVLVVPGLSNAIANRQALLDVPQSIVTPQVPLVSQRATEDQQLSTYGWVDQPHGITHIPITRAMDLFAQQNQPSQPPGEWF